jgi:hypothetical protein
MRARQAVLRDVFRRDDEAVVMAGANVVRLSPLATYLVDVMPNWRTREELVRALVDRFGHPADRDATEFVEATLIELADLEIVEVEP